LKMKKSFLKCPHSEIYEHAIAGMIESYLEKKTIPRIDIHLMPTQELKDLATLLANGEFSMENIQKKYGKTLMDYYLEIDMKYLRKKIWM